MITIEEFYDVSSVETGVFKVPTSFEMLKKYIEIALKAIKVIPQRSSK